ncbi:MAG: DUF835 domain-containing protein, partial [Thermoplasmata archaeon]|nr:DUF835 domain-containing protein [Thermoplasmata archaeon]
GASTFNLIAEKDHDRIQENMKITLKEGSVRNIEYTFRTKGGLEFPGELSTGIITDLVGNPLSYVALTKDITERKRTEEEMKRRLMKFKIEDGRLYLVKESVPSLSYEALKDLLKIGYHGFVISRTPEQDFKKIFINNNFEFLWLAEKGGNNNKNTFIKEIEARIEKLPTKNTVLIERVDYLIFKKGFKKTLAFVQHLREFAYLFGNIIILSIDPSTLSTQELRLLEKEGLEIEPRIDLKKMPEEYFNILKFVYQENITGIRPSYYNVGKEIGISKPTVRKRINFLLSNGYILENTRGRNKVLELSEMGRNLFYN